MPLSTPSPSPGMLFWLLHMDMSLSHPSGLRSGSPPPRKLPCVPAGNSNNVTLEKGLHLGQCPCRVLRYRNNSGALGVIWEAQQEGGTPRPSLYTGGGASCPRNSGGRAPPRLRLELLAVGWASHIPIRNEGNCADRGCEPRRGSPLGWGQVE